MDSTLGGGATEPVPKVVRVLQDAGAEVEIYALERRDGRGLPAILEAGLTVHVREGAKKDNLTAYRWLDNKLNSFQPTIIWTSLTRAYAIGILVGWRRHIPVVTWQHIDYLKPQKLFFTHLLRSRPIMWIGDSDMVTELTAKRFKVPPDRLACWPLFSATPDMPQSQPWQPGQTLRLGSLGRLRPIKGYDVLMKALTLLMQKGFRAPVPFEIDIAGEGTDGDILKELAQKAEFSNLNLLGFTDKPHDFLATLHLYLQPSRGEGLCIAMHEAMQAGLPVIASTVGQMPYSVENEKSGWLVPPDDVEALADALANALSKPEQLAAMGKAARDRVLTRYSQDAFRKAGESILERIENMLGSKAK